MRDWTSMTAADFGPRKPRQYVTATDIRELHAHARRLRKAADKAAAKPAAGAR